MLLFNLNQKLWEKTVLVSQMLTTPLFGIKTCSNRNHWEHKHIKGRGVDERSEWAQPKSLLAEIPGDWFLLKL